MNPEHAYSTFALDVYWTSGRTGDLAIAAHVTECDSCRAYLALLDEEDARTRDGSNPRILIPRVARGAGRLRATMAVTAGLSLAAGLALFLQTARKPRPPTYVGVKGTPSVQLLVHRGSETAIWDGRSPVRAGDALALRAACGEFTEITVAVEDPAPPGAWARLSGAVCPKADDVLPFTLVIDGRSPEERLAVVMSDAPLSPGALSRAAESSERSPHAWVVRFVLPEERQ